MPERRPGKKAAEKCRPDHLEVWLVLTSGLPKTLSAIGTTRLYRSHLKLKWVLYLQLDISGHHGSAYEVLHHRTEKCSIKNGKKSRDAITFLLKT